MVSYLHLPIVATCFLLLLAMWRFWACINRMGFTREVGRRAPAMIRGDILTAVFAIMPFLIAAVDWLGVSLPHQPVPIPPLLAVILSGGCLGACVFILRDSSERFAGHWAGTQESALRTVAALRIINAAELSHALKVFQDNEARLKQEGQWSPEVEQTQAVIKKVEAIEGEVRRGRK